MLSFIAKKLVKQPLGALLEITITEEGGQVRTLRGKIIDSDFETGMELLLDSGESYFLDASTVKGWKFWNPEADASGPKPEPTVQSAPAPTPAPAPRPGTKAAVFTIPAFFQEQPAKTFNYSDAELKERLSLLPREDKKVLDGLFQSFTAALKNNNKQRQLSIAQTARRYVTDAMNDDIDLPRETVLFCGGIMGRVNVYDCAVFEWGYCYPEAAYCAWRNKDYPLAAALAMRALLDEQSEDARRECMKLIYLSILQGDGSGAERFLNAGPRMPEADLWVLLRSLYAAKEQPCPDTIQEAAAGLARVYPGVALEEALCQWDLFRSKAEIEEEAPEVQPEPTKPRYNQPGIITRWDWSEKKGILTNLYGESFTFTPDRIDDPSIRKQLENCTRSDLGGDVIHVLFTQTGSEASQILPDYDFVTRLNALLSDGVDGNCLQHAFDLCKKNLTTKNARNAIRSLVEVATRSFDIIPDNRFVTEALELYEQYSGIYPTGYSPLLYAARCYDRVKKYNQMLSLLEQAMADPAIHTLKNVTPVRVVLILLWNYYQECGNKQLPQKMLEYADQVHKSQSAITVTSPDGNTQQKSMKTFYRVLGYYMVLACQPLGLLERATEILSNIPGNTDERSRAVEIVEQMQKEHAEALRLEAQLHREQMAAEMTVESMEEEEDFPESEEEEEEIIPYSDAEGWAALNLTEADVAGYALALRHPQKIPFMNAYLAAAASLNPNLYPLYRHISLASGDPMAADYSINSLLSMLENRYPEYSILSDYCLASAYLRASFQAGRGVDYDFLGLRGSITVQELLPVLGEVYDILEDFRKHVRMPMDIYADYRSHAFLQQKEEAERICAEAADLYSRYVADPNAERNFRGRALIVRNKLFGKDSYLAQMLRFLADQDADALEGDKEIFLRAWLKNPGNISPGQIDMVVVRKFVDDAWEQACKETPNLKTGSFVHGPRDQTTSVIMKILSVLCRWYALNDRISGQSWRSEEGEALYREVKPALLEKLQALENQCEAEMAECADDEFCTGLLLLADAARDLRSRLDGSRRSGQERFFYADFLRSNAITLNEDFLPELDATFCVLPELNILSRLRSHFEQEHPDFREQLKRIYGADPAHRNYGSARQIAEYLRFTGDDDNLPMPENRELFHTKTEEQAQLLQESFQQRYGMALSYGQIIKSDPFSHTLRDTVRYWFTRSQESRNFGLFFTLVPLAEARIHSVARQYELKMERELDSLIQRNESYFAGNPGVEAHIREQIHLQNFTVAEDWMSRIRVEEFSLDVTDPEALDYLRGFWAEFMDIYDIVSSSRTSLLDSLQRREARSRNTRWAKELIECWIPQEKPSDPDKVLKLLKLLGWDNMTLERCRTDEEVYRVRREPSGEASVAPQHPIAPFGSDLDRRPMYISCLYGSYNCDSLLEECRRLEKFDGPKVLLLDYTLSEPDRRSLAQKMKRRESPLRHPCILIDRVLITYLARQFSPSTINRILMAVSMPFAYHQPYVVDSNHTMPPEIFIGRVEELKQIESPEGVNLVYGGRQLGKSALFKKAVSDLDQHEGQRAVLVDINKRGCAAAAKQVSAQLVDMEILPESAETDNWDDLCRSIGRMLRKNPDVPYFLLMLDEADTFISDCAAQDYLPLVALKNLQQSLPGRFKYVLAGLHDLVRFNRQVSLGNNSVIPHMPYLKVTPFRTPEAQELLTMPLSYLGFSIPNKAIISHILATCNYFPGLIQLYGRMLVQSMRGPDYAGYDVRHTPPYIISDAHLQRVIADEEFNRQIVNKFTATLQLDEKEENLYTPLALLIGWLYYNDPSTEGYTAKDLLRHASGLGITRLAALDEELIDALLAELQELNILRSVSQGTYLLASKNYLDLLGSDEEIGEKLDKFGGKIQ